MVEKKGIRGNMKYIKIIHVGTSPTGKTNIWSVQTLENVEIGFIKWFGSWRKYVFWPHSGTLYDASCLKEITEFINEQMNKRK